MSEENKESEKGGIFEIWLTKGMFGERLEKIGRADSFDDAMQTIAVWKKSRAGDPGYKIEPYDRIVQGGERGTAVDFGDYHMFMLIFPRAV